MIYKTIVLSILLIFTTVGQIQATPQSKLTPLPKHSLSTIMITKFVDQLHYSQVQLNDERSAKIFEGYLKSLDPNRNIFTRGDIEQFNQYRTKLDDALQIGDLTPAFTMFQRFNKRRVERADYALKRLQQTFDFSIDESYVFDRENATWPKDEKALDEIWRKRVKNDYLTLLLAGKEEKDLKETLRKRYERFKTRANQLKSEDVYEAFINSYLQNVEPHTAYFSPRTSENFNINMSLSLEGIGAVLQTIDEYTVVKRVIKGGPADLSHQLHAGDKIIGVGQGSKKVEDVIGWRLDDVVEKIRGPKDSIVQLHILPEDSGVGGTDKTITIVRNKIKLEEQRVKKSIIDVPDGLKTRKIGVIEVPTFYMDFAAAARGDKDYSSTTRDTKKIIDELRADKVDGIVVDLRSNGGGSLVEAVSFTGLFIKTGPVVQIRNTSGEIQLNEDEDESIAYTGPLAVLVDGNSASASEIFAGAIKDYGRGIIVGEPTFGKGTVQSVIDLNKYARDNQHTLGRLKLTMAQFFRINGDSTQHRGVVPDIVFPTAIQSDERGERSLENALPWARISAAQYTPNLQKSVDLDDIKKRHLSRVSNDSGFSFLHVQSKIRQDSMKDTQLSLLMEKRKSEREQKKKERNERLNKFRESRGIKKVALTQAEDEINEEENKKLSDELQLVSLREAARILVDLNRNQVLTTCLAKNC